MYVVVYVCMYVCLQQTLRFSKEQLVDLQSPLIRLQLFLQKSMYVYMYVCMREFMYVYVCVLPFECVCSVHLVHSYCYTYILAYINTYT